MLCFIKLLAVKVDLKMRELFRMINRKLVFSLFVILLPHHINTVKADEWDLSKVNSTNDAHHLQKWCKTEGNLIRYSNTEVAGYQPCGELKTIVVCDALGKKLISSGPPPHGYKECSETPRLIVQRIGPPLPETKSEEEPVAFAKNTAANPSEQISNGLKSYQDYINSLDQITDEQSTPSKSNQKLKPSDLDSLTKNISPEMLSKVVSLLSQMSQ